MKKIITLLITILLILSQVFNSFAIAQMSNDEVTNLVRKDVDDTSLKELENKIFELEMDTKEKVKNKINEYLASETPFLAGANVKIKKVDDENKWKIFSENEEFQVINAVDDDSQHFSETLLSAHINEIGGDKENTIFHLTFFNCKKFDLNTSFEMFGVPVDVLSMYKKSDGYAFDTDSLASYTVDVFYFKRDHFIATIRRNNSYDFVFQFIADGENNYRTTKLSEDTLWVSNFKHANVTAVDSVPKLNTLNDLAVFCTGCAYGNSSNPVAKKSTYVVKLGYDDYTNPTAASANPHFEFYSDEYDNNYTYQGNLASRFFLTVYSDGETLDKSQIVIVAKPVYTNNEVFVRRYFCEGNKWSPWSEVGTNVRFHMYQASNDRTFSATGNFGSGTYWIIRTFFKVGQYVFNNVKFEMCGWSAPARTAGTEYVVGYLPYTTSRLPSRIASNSKAIGTLVNPAYEKNTSFGTSQYNSIWLNRGVFYLLNDDANNRLVLYYYCHSGRAADTLYGTIQFFYISTDTYSWTHRFRDEGGSSSSYEILGNQMYN